MWLDAEAIPTVVLTDWLSWPEVAELVGCPVGTIDWHTRTGRIEHRQAKGNRPSLKRESVEAFAVCWAERQAAKERKLADAELRSQEWLEPPEPTGWVSAAEAAEILGVNRRHIPWLVAHGRLRAVMRGRRRWVDEVSLRTEAEAQRQEAEEWVSHVEAARIVGCSPQTILRAAKAGLIQRRVVGRAQPSLSRESVSDYAGRCGGAYTVFRGSLNPLDLRETSNRPDREALDLSKVNRSCIVVGEWHTIECAVRADGTSPAREFLDLIKTGTWEDDPEVEEIPDDEQVRDYHRLIDSLRYIAVHGEPRRPKDVNYLGFGLWEVKLYTKRLVFYDTNGHGGFLAKAKTKLRQDSNNPDSDMWWFPELDYSLRLANAWCKTDTKADPLDINEARRIREEDLAHDRVEK